MKKINFPHNLSPILGLLLLLGTHAANAQSNNTGICTATNGTKQYNVTIRSGDINPGNNSPGTILRNQGLFPLEIYQGFCDCELSITDKIPTYYTARASGGIIEEAGGDKFYALNGDAAEYLLVATRLFLVTGGNAGNPHPVPFQKESNNTPENSSCWTGNNQGSFNLATGGSGEVSLYIRKSFTGSKNIARTLIAEIRGSKNPDTIDSAPVLAQVYLSGEVIIPTTCKVNNGTVIPVNFGDISLADFKTIGAKPENYAPQAVTLSVTCNNTESNMTVNLLFSGKYDSDPAQLSTDKDDIAIKLINNTQEIKFDQISRYPLSIIDGYGQLPLTSYPVKTKDTLKPGPYDAITTITVSPN